MRTLALIIFLCAGLNAQMMSHQSRSDGGAAPPVDDCAGYEICQNFEGAGYDNSESWTEAGGTINEDYTTTVLRGSQSLAISDGGTTSYTYAAIVDYATTDTSYWCHFMVQTDSISSAGTTTIGGIYDNISPLASASFRDYGSGGLRLYANTSINIAYAVAKNTAYHIWLYYQTGSGSDGIARLYIDTDNTIPETPQGEMTNTTRTVVPNRFILWNSRTGSTFVYDQAIGDSSAIGDVSE